MPRGTKQSTRKPKPRTQRPKLGSTRKRSTYSPPAPRMNTLDQMREQDANAMAKPATVPAPTMEGARGLFREQKLLTLDHVKLLLDEIGTYGLTTEEIIDRMRETLEQEPDESDTED